MKVTKKHVKKNNEDETSKWHRTNCTVTHGKGNKLSRRTEGEQKPNTATAVTSNKTRLTFQTRK